MEKSWVAAIYRCRPEKPDEHSTYLMIFLPMELPDSDRFYQLKQRFQRTKFPNDFAEKELIEEYPEISYVEGVFTSFVPPERTDDLIWSSKTDFASYFMPHYDIKKYKHNPAEHTQVWSTFDERISFFMLKILGTAPLEELFYVIRPDLPKQINSK